MAYILQYTKDSEFVKYTYERLVNTIIGNLIISIGKGKFEDEVNNALSMAICWYKYKDEVKHE